MYVSKTFQLANNISHMIKKVYSVVIHGRENLKESFYTFKKDYQSAMNLHGLMFFSFWGYPKPGGSVTDKIKIFI